MRVRIGYQLAITTLFVGLVLTVGMGLVYLSFDRAKMISRSAATTYIDRVAAHTADQVDGSLKEVVDALEVLRALPSVDAAAIAGNPPLYALMAALLRQHVQFYNLYVGYDDGDFIELDALERAGSRVRTQIGAPAGAAFRLTVITKNAEGGARIRHTTFLSPDLATIAETSGAASYDPRERPWYRDEFEPGAPRITAPYVFGVGLIGYTVRTPLTTGRRGIVAGDLLLTDSDAFLRSQKLGKSGVVFLFDDQGRVLAHPRMSEFLKARAGGVLELPRLEQVEAVDVRQPLSASQASGSAPQVFEAADRRTYVAAFRPILATGSTRLRVAVMAPLDEFFSEIESQRQELMLLTLLLVVATLPIVWWLGAMLARSMRALAAETDHIRRFELAAPAKPVRSMIREIDDLGRSVSTMRAVVQAFSSFIPRRLVERLIETGVALH